MTREAEAAEVDVAIVGYGPVGAALAVLLGQLGRRVVVLERRPAPYPRPRAVHFDDEVGRVLQACGIGKGLASISEPADVYEWRNGSGTTLLRFGGRGAGPAGWPASSMFHQPSLEALLDARVRTLPNVEVRRGADVTAVEETGAGAVLRATDAAGGPFEIPSRFVVGCDGANSTVRGLVDSPVHDLGFFFDWLIVDVVLDRPRVFDPVNLQICDPARPTTAVSGGPGRRRWEFMRLPGERREDLGDEAVAWGLLAPWDVTPANATLERHAVYTFNARWAERWRVGPTMLAGDAAHQMPPFAGQGLCTGLRDAANLAWKLDLVLGGQAPGVLLDSYAEERMPHARGGIEFSMELGKVICVPDPAEAAARDEAMSAAVGAEPMAVPALPPLDGPLGRAGDPLAGHPFPQGVVAAGGRTGLFDDVVGVGWRLVSVGPVTLDPGVAAWFASIGGRVVTVGPGGGVEDVDGTYTRWFAGHGRRVALQRPDFYLFGTGEGEVDAVTLVSAARAALGG